jgi:ATP-binding cassette, subfamily C (CFTR/MRP), member 1
VFNPSLQLNFIHMHFSHSPPGSSVWLKVWAQSNQDAGGNEYIGKFIGIYFAFGIGSSLLTVVQTLVLWIFCSIEV